MNPTFKRPPSRKSALKNPRELAKTLETLIGQDFTLTGKARTDGSNLRKLVTATLEGTLLTKPAATGDYQVIPPGGKGVPKILLEYIDTYIVTSGTSYNLQVWNRNPAEESVQIEYNDGDTLLASEVRFVLVKIDTENNKISSIAVLSSDYIENEFGRFGKPTVKQQLIISDSARQRVLQKPNGMLFYPDILHVGKPGNARNLSGISIHSAPTENYLLPLENIKEKIESHLIGRRINPSATKKRGQMLEKMTVDLLGYQSNDTELLAGGYPDLRNQALEVKVQDSPTVDLGMYSPEFEEDIAACPGFNTKSIRYFVALTNPQTSEIEGAIVCPGVYLGRHFTYVGDKNYKCQRSIPMRFFDNLSGRSVFNP